MRGQGAITEGEGKLAEQAMSGKIDFTAAELRTICVSIIERMTRRGLSREDQCLGAFYVLATLTIVNQDARNALPWLYEAVL